MKRILAFSMILAPLISLAAWWYWGEMRFRHDLLNLSLDESGQASIANAIELNTFDDDVSSESIGRCYYSACRRLDSLRGSRPRRTYRWEDSITYPGMSSIVQYPSHYVEVCASSGNDSDEVALRVVPGQFPTSEHFNVKEVSGSEVPFLRLPSIYYCSSCVLFLTSPEAFALCLCAFVLIFFLLSRPAADGLRTFPRGDPALGIRHLIL